MNERHEQPTARQEREPAEQQRPAVWVGCLASYTNGHLHGEWITADVPTEELVNAVQQMLASSPEPNAEEWAIFDFDHFGAYRIEQYDRLEQVAAVARGITEHGPAFAAWAELHDGEEAMLAGFSDAYLGEFDSPEAWARELLDESALEAKLDAAVPASLRPHLRFDYAGFARDTELGGEVHIEQAPDGQVWIFLIT